MLKYEIGITMHKEEKRILTTDNIELHADIVENGSPVWIVMTHGLGEHCGRHRYIYKLFSQYFNICLYDLRGHGKSSGKRGYASSFRDFTSDLGTVISYLRENYSMERYYLIGHSMGGLVTSSYMQNHVDKDFYPEKVLLSAPATSGAGLPGKFFNIAPISLMKSLTNLPVTIPLAGVLDITKLSHDPRVYENYITDELNVLKVHSKLFLEILYEARRVFSRPLRVSCELYCALGTRDYLVDSETTINYFQNVEKNVNLKIIEGGYHELHNEIHKYSDQYFEFLKTSIMDEVYN